MAKKKKEDKNNKEDKKKWFMKAPKRDPKNKRDIRIQVSVSQNDKAELKKKADEVQFPLAEYMYWVLKNRTLHIQNIEFSKNLRLIANESDNLNQLAFNGNAFHYLSDEDVKSLRKIIKKLDKLIEKEVEHLNNQ